MRRDAEGKVVADSRAGGKFPEGIAVRSGPLAPHTLENVGASGAASDQRRGEGRENLWSVMKSLRPAPFSQL